MTKTKKEHLSREALVAATRLRRDTVSVPENGGVVLIQEFSADARLAYIEYLEIGADNMPHMKPDKQVTLSKLILSLGCINEDGTPMFKDMDDVPDMRDDAYEAIDKAILRLSGIIPAEVPDNLPNVKPTDTAPSP